VNAVLAFVNQIKAYEANQASFAYHVFCICWR